MAKIKIGDIPEDLRLSREDLRKAVGGVSFNYGKIEVERTTSQGARRPGGSVLIFIGDIGSIDTHPPSES